MNAEEIQGDKRSTSPEVERQAKVERAEFCARLESLIPDRKENEFARTAGISANALRHTMKTGNPGRANLVAMAKAAGVTVEWLATGAGPMRPGQAPQAPVAAPQSQAPQGVKEGLSHAYQARYGAATGVKAAVSLAVAALGDQSQHIEPERLADLIDAAHQLLQAGADPALVRRLIAAAAGP